MKLGPNREEMKAARKRMIKARDLLERDGWGKRFLQNPVTGCRCLTGALIDAGPFHVGYHEEYSLASTIITNILKMNGRAQYITTFNDEPETTLEDVMMLLAAAINATRLS